MFKPAAALVLAVLPAVALAATPPPRWTVMADCAAAYKANAAIKDPTRPSSMRHMIASQANDYVKAAVKAYRDQAKASDGQARRSVADYVAKASAALSHKPRSENEHMIEACPQTGS
jgi:hypothetical protein